MIYDSFDYSDSNEGTKGRGESDPKGIVPRKKIS